MKRFTIWEEARDYAQDYANRLSLDVAIRKTTEYGKAGFNVSIASKLDCDYDRAEIVKPNEPMDTKDEQD